LRGIAHAIGIDCELETNGALQVCNTNEDAAQGQAYVDKARQFGIPSKIWDQCKTAAALGSVAYAGGLFDPNTGQLHPGKLVAVLKSAAQFAGVEIFEKSPVVHIEEGPQHCITTANGRTVKAKILVLATNAYSSQLGYLRRAVRPSTKSRRNVLSWPYAG